MQNLIHFFPLLSTLFHFFPARVMPLLLNLLPDLLPGEQIPGVSARLVTVTGPVQSVHRAPLGMGLAEAISLTGSWIS